MNLLIQKEPESQENENDILIENYRSYQYDLIEYFFTLMINHISNNNNNYLSLSRIEKEEIFTYSGIHQSELIEYSIYTRSVDDLTDIEPEKLFVRIHIPKLIENNYYILNGHVYTPMIYIVDKPIVIKENSINLMSLFSPITIYFTKKFVKFGGKNIDLEYFAYLYLHDDESDEANEIKSYLKITDLDIEDIINYFAKLFNRQNKIENIKAYVHNLFFDEYTKYLYFHCYFSSGEIQESLSPDDLSFGDIMKFALIRYIRNESFNFIDLNNKRLSFIELILAPIIQRCANIAHQAKRGFRPNQMNYDQIGIVKNFLKSTVSRSTQKVDNLGFSGLSGKNIYDIVNLYSCILSYKASFIKPGMSRPPSIVSNIHESHFGRICPITVSSESPGENISLIPGTKFDCFGQFI